MVAKLTDVLVWEKLPLSALSKVCSALAAFGRLGLVDPEGSRPRLRTRLRRAQVELPKWIQPGAGTPADSVIFEVDDLEPVELEKNTHPF